MKEQEIRRQFRNAVKIQEKQYKILKEHKMQQTLKADQKALLSKLKDDQMRRLAMLADQYEQSINEVMTHQNVNTSFNHFLLYLLLEVPDNRCYMQ